MIDIAFDINYIANYVITVIQVMYLGLTHN